MIRWLRHQLRAFLLLSGEVKYWHDGQGTAEEGTFTTTQVEVDTVMGLNSHEHGKQLAELRQRIESLEDLAELSKEYMAATTDLRSRLDAFVAEQQQVLELLHSCQQSAYQTAKVVGTLAEQTRRWARESAVLAQIEQRYRAKLARTERALAPVRPPDAVAEPAAVPAEVVSEPEPMPEPAFASMNGQRPEGD